MGTGALSGHCVPGQKAVALGQLLLTGVPAGVQQRQPEAGPSGPIPPWLCVTGFDAREQLSAPPLQGGWREHSGGRGGDSVQHVQKLLRRPQELLA